MQTIVVELDDELAERLAVVAQREGSSIPRLLEEFARQIAEAAIPRHTTPANPIETPTVGSPTNRITTEELLRAIEEADFEYDMKKIGLNPDGSPYTGTDPR